MSIAKENTFRALKDQPLLATNPWRCQFGFHQWTKWSDPVARSDSIWIRQRRFCVACNRFEDRKTHE